MSASSVPPLDSVNQLTPPPLHSVNQLTKTQSEALSSIRTRCFFGLRSYADQIINGLSDESCRKLNSYVRANYSETTEVYKAFERVLDCCYTDFECALAPGKDSYSKNKGRKVLNGVLRGGAIIGVPTYPSTTEIFPEIPIKAFTPIADAVIYGNKEIAVAIIKRNNFKTKDECFKKDINIALLDVCEVFPGLKDEDRLEIVQELLKAGADPKVPHWRPYEKLMTYPLVEAANSFVSSEKDNVKDIVKELLKYGANPRATRGPKEAIICALQKENEGAAIAILEAILANGLGNENNEVLKEAFLCAKEHRMHNFLQKMTELIPNLDSVTS